MQSKNQTSINLFSGKIVHSESDPIWYRLIVLVIVIAFIIGVLWIMKAWAIPVLTARNIDFFNLFKIGKGRSP